MHFPKKIQNLPTPEQAENKEWLSNSKITFKYFRVITELHPKLQIIAFSRIILSSPPGAQSSTFSECVKSDSAAVDPLSGTPKAQCMYIWRGEARESNCCLSTEPCAHIRTHSNANMGCDPRKTIIAAAQVEYLNTSRAPHTHMQRGPLSKRRRPPPLLPKRIVCVWAPQYRHYVGCRGLVVVVNLPNITPPRTAWHWHFCVKI
jgi:hypothetical protein